MSSFENCHAPAVSVDLRWACRRLRVRDALLKALSDRVRVFTDSGAADVVLDDAALQVAAELTAIAGEYLDTEQAVVADILHTVAAYYWARALAHRDAALAAADHREAMQIFGLLYLLDHRRVPRALWGQLTEETGHDPWRDPVNRASDLVLDAEESGDLSGLAQATALLGEAPASLYRDTMLGIALCLRAGDHDRPNADRLADAETAVELLDGVAATSEESPARRASRRLTLANAFTQRFILSGDHADLAASESAARTAFTEAPEGSTEQEDAAAAIGLSLGRCSDGEPTYQAVTLLQESVQWLRLAVDLGTASGREPRHRVNLRTAMGRLLERTNLVRKDQQDEHAEQETRDKPDKPDERAVQAPPLSPDDTRQARALLDMAEWVASRIIPEAEAVRRVVTPAFLLSRDTADAVVGAAMGLVDSGDSERALPTLILTLEAAAARWGTGPESPWWPAADAYVEAVRHSLVSRPDGVRFHRAHDIVRAQIDVLRGRSETEELAETLYAAGLLHLSPYTSDMSGLTFDSADRLRQERQDRHRALHLDDAAGHPMPSPEEAVAAAVKYLRDAAHLSSGHALGRALRSLAEALSFLAGMQGKSYDQEILGAARTAFDVLDPRRDPLGRLYLLRVLNMFSEVALPRELSGLLPVPLATIRRQRGEREASAVFAEALTLTDEAHRPDLQAGLIDLADRDLPDLSSDAQRRLRWQIEVHLLAGNRLTCVVGPMRVDAVAEEIRSRADAEGWSAVERAATLVHLAAHAHPAETGNACRDLLDEARRFAPQVFERYADALHYLDAVGCTCGGIASAGIRCRLLRLRRIPIRPVRADRPRLGGPRRRAGVRVCTRGTVSQPGGPRAGSGIRVPATGRGRDGGLDAAQPVSGARRQVDRRHRRSFSDGRCAPGREGHGLHHRGGKSGTAQVLGYSEPVARAGTTRGGFAIFPASRLRPARWG
ncbi:hypothetical protein AB1484_12060 [Parafrankia sp. FMc6]|uniref:hypothetical protein n=1 Tax=Parafrankia soli TaxID=2599596 RepID=UPI0034D5541E